MRYLIILTFLISGSTYAEEINLSCNYKETYYRNWDMGQFGQTFYSEDAQKSIFFKITKYEGENLFKSDLMIHNTQWLKEKNDTLTDVSNDNFYWFNWYSNKNKRYISIRINRFSGELTHSTGSDDDRYYIKDTFNCEKVTKRF